MKICLSFFIYLYKLFISPVLPKSCRYYPTCSEFALQKLKFSGFFQALFAILFRILKCNPLFKGGFDYPVVKRTFKINSLSFNNSKIIPNYWFVPLCNDKYYLIKVFDSLKGK